MPANYERTYGVATVTDATVTITDDGYLGVPIVFNRAAAAAVTATLPAATGSGNKYRFIGAADAAANQIIKVANASDTMAGVALLNDANFNTADTSDTITLNGGTTGGLKGWQVEVIDIAANLWAVTVISEATDGSEATPFSAAVS